GDLCLNVFPGGGVPPGPSKLVVVWENPSNEGMLEPAFEMQLSGRERSLSIPLARVRPPTSVSPIAPQAWGYIVVLPPNAPEFSKSNFLGVAYVMLVYSVPGTPAGLFGGKFPNGLRDGTAVYAMVKPLQGRHDNFWLAPPGAVFDLVLCPPGAVNCDPPWPNPN
ncbi:MAG: hypothetical protein AB7S68_13960, partial [Polyangiaceae bacterium]